jgi:tetratricopeptide (TPR) repeat protein
MNLQELCNRALVFHQQGNLAQAERLYLEILALEPGNFIVCHLLGIVRHQQGRNAEALQLIGTALTINPNFAEARSNQGNILNQLGRFEEALASLDKALAIKPDFAEALNNRGGALQGLNRVEAALVSFDQALALKSDYPQALSNRGAVLLRLNRFGEALASFEKLLAIMPGNIEALHDRGLCLKGLNRFEEALASFDEALAINPVHGEALINRADALRHLNRFEEALASFDKALAIRPDSAEVLNNRGVILLILSRFEEALAAFDKVLAIKPDYSEALNNRGGALRSLNRFGEALASFDKALAINPGYIEARNNRGVLLTILNRSEEALASFDAVLALKPDHGNALNNRGGALQQLHRFEEASASFAKALAIQPDYAQAWVNRAHCALLRGHFDQGWRWYEWRKKLPNLFKPRNYPQPEWTGREDISGKTLFLYAEQGLGDTIQFFRYAALAQARGAKVILSAQDSLMPLLKISNPALALVGPQDVPSNFDVYAALLSLPLAFETDLKNIPATVPYLRTEPERVAAWAARIGKRDFKIGISWQGKKNTETDIGRSFPLRHFERLSKLPHVRLISLQKGAGVEQLLDLPAGMTVETLGADFDDGPDGFLVTAAVMENLDLIITSDTAVAHLAGALGRPTWVALQCTPDWRWLLDRSDSPWYPTMRLFRQPSQGDWPGVFAQIQTQLAELICRK